MARLDRDVFDQLVRSHHAAAYASALRVVRQSDVAADVVQDVFLRALQGRLDLSAARSPRAVLCWCATRLAQNAVRAGRRRRTHEETSAMLRNDRSAATFPDHAPSAGAGGDESARELRRHVDELPDALRLPLLLRYEDELTFAAIGSALAIGEATAHDRVRRALDRLRARLTSAGFAAAALDLEARLAVPVPVPAPPPGLATRLLALAAPRPFVAAVLAKAALPMLLAAVGVAAVVAGGGTGEPPPAGAGVAVAALPAADGPAPAPGGATRRAVPLPAAREGAQDPMPQPPLPPQPEREGVVTFAGTVCDADGVPSPQLRVQATAAGGVKPFELAATTTDAAGAFVLRVPLAGKVAAKRIRVVVGDPRALFTSDELPLQAGAAPAPLALRLPRDAGLERERFTIDVTVRDADGAPLAGVPVRLHAQATPPPVPGRTPADAAATTDANGTARLSGRTPGRQLVFVDARGEGCTAVVDTVDVAAGAAVRHAVTVAAGATLRARIELVDGGAPAWANVWLVDERTGLTHAGALQPGNEATFAALGDGPFTLHVHANPFSPVARRGLRPGGAVVTVRLKAHDDERDVGDHEAEIHGRLVDATTGEVVAYEPFAVEVRPAAAGESTLLLDRIAPPRPVQRASDGQRRERFHAVGLDAGEHGVVAWVEGYAPATAIVPLCAGELRTDVELRLHRPAVIAGTVVDRDGRPAAGVRVTVVGVGERADANVHALLERGAAAAPEREPPASSCGSVRTDAAGRFELLRLPPFVQLRVVAIGEGVHDLAPALALQPAERRAGLVLRVR